MIDYGMKFLIDDVFKSFDVKKFNFPKYSTQFINLANQNAKGTAPAVVGQMSELIHQCPQRTIDSWKNWYLKNYSDKIDIATDKVWKKLQEMKEGYDAITKDIVKDRVYDLVITKTAEGLMIQEFILKELSKKFKKKYRLATPQEEAKNIDGYIEDIPLQIKSATYDSKKSTVREKIDAVVIYYNQTDKYLSIDDTQLSNRLSE